MHPANTVSIHIFPVCLPFVFQQKTFVVGLLYVRCPRWWESTMKKVPDVTELLFGAGGAGRQMLLPSGVT